MTRPFHLGFIGAGNMAEGIVGGVLHAGLCTPDRMIASDPSAEQRNLFAGRFGLTVVDDNARVAKESDIIFLAVKPQTFGQVATTLAPCLAGGPLIVSIMAGWSTLSVAKLLGGESVRVVRVMPNLPIRLGAGVTGICGGAGTTPADVATVQRVFDSAGQTVLLSQEDLMDAVTAVSGSGPAYYYYVTEAIAAGGVAAGLTQEQAMLLAKNTCLGAARMMLETGSDPAELRRQVTSPGGTTQAALATMKWSGVFEAIRHAVTVAARRSKELGK